MSSWQCVRCRQWNESPVSPGAQSGTTSNEGGSGLGLGQGGPQVSLPTSGSRSAGTSSCGTSSNPEVSSVSDPPSTTAGSDPPLTLNLPDIRRSGEGEEPIEADESQLSPEPVLPPAVQKCGSCGLGRDKSQWQCGGCQIWVANDAKRCPVCSMWDPATPQLMQIQGEPEPKRARLDSGLVVHNTSSKYLGKGSGPPGHHGISGSGPACGSTASFVGGGMNSTLHPTHSTTSGCSGGGKGKLRRPPQSWHCAECYYDNWMMRETCNKCLKPRAQCEGPDLGVKRKLPDPTKALLQVSAEFAAGVCSPVAGACSAGVGPPGGVPTPNICPEVAGVAQGIKPGQRDAAHLPTLLTTTMSGSALPVSKVAEKLAFPAGVAVAGGSRVPGSGAGSPNRNCTDAGKDGFVPADAAGGHPTHLAKGAASCSMKGAPNGASNGQHPGKGGGPAIVSSNGAIVHPGGTTSTAAAPTGTPGLKSLAAVLGNRFDAADLERAFNSSRELRETAAAQGIHSVQQLQAALVGILSRQQTPVPSPARKAKSACQGSNPATQGGAGGGAGKGFGGSYSTVQTLRMTETGQVIPVQSWNRNGGPRGEKTTEISIDSLNSLFREGCSPDLRKAGEEGGAEAGGERVMYEAILAKLKETKNHTEEEEYDFDAFEPDPFLKSPGTTRVGKLENHPALESYGISGAELATLLKFWAASPRQEAEICPRYHAMEQNAWNCATCRATNSNQDRICVNCDEIRESTQWFCRHSCKWQDNDQKDCQVCKRPRQRCEATPEMEIFRIFGYKHQETEEGTTYEDLVHGMVCVAKRILKRYTIMEEKERQAAAAAAAGATAAAGAGGVQPH